MKTGHNIWDEIEFFQQLKQNLHFKNKNSVAGSGVLIGFRFVYERSIRIKLVLYVQKVFIITYKHLLYRIDQDFLDPFHI